MLSVRHKINRRRFMGGAPQKVTTWAELRSLEKRVARKEAVVAAMLKQAVWA